MKIFEKVKKINGRRHVYFCGLKVGSYKKGVKNCTVKKNKTYDIFDQYVDLCDEGKQPCYAEIYEGGKLYIWQCWWQGLESAPPIVLRCMESVRRCTSDLECEIVIVTKDNYTNYFSIPEYILRKVKSGAISLTHLSDYIRVSLLSKYGGIWIDATCYLTASIPCGVLKSHFFQFRVPCVLLSREVNRRENKISITGSSWFIRSAPGHRISVGIKKALEKYWFNEDDLSDYFLFHYLLSVLITKDDDCRREYLQMMYLPNDVPHLMQSILRKPYNSELYDEITKMSFIHKLTYKDIEKEEGSLYSYLLSTI